MNKQQRVLNLLIVSQILLCTAVLAQDTTPPLKKDQPAQKEILDLSVPESPAFTILGVTPQTVVRPVSPRSFATSLLNGVDQQGNFQSGTAFDVAPYQLFSGNSLTLARYRTNKTVQFLSNTQVSFATTKGAGDSDKSIRVGLGFHFTLFDKGDPRLYPGSTKDTYFIDEHFAATQAKITLLQHQEIEDRFRLLKTQRDQLAGITDPAQKAAMAKQFREENAKQDYVLEVNHIKVIDNSKILDQRILRDYAIELGPPLKDKPLLDKTDFGANQVNLENKLADPEFRAKTWRKLVAENDAVPDKPDKQVADQQDLLRKETQAYQAALRKLTWNRSSWIVAGAPSWISPDGTTKKLQLNGGGIWTSYAYGFEGVPGLENTSQLIFHVRYRVGEHVADAVTKGAFYQQDSFFAGVRLRIGSPDAVVNFEGSFIHAKPDQRASEDYFRFAAGTELKITKDQWLTLSVGGEGGRRNGGGQAFVLTAFKYGFSGGP